MSLTYAWAVELIPPDKLEDWEFDLVSLLPWQDGESEAEIEMQSASFFDMMSKNPD